MASFGQMAKTGQKLAKQVMPDLTKSNLPKCEISKKFASKNSRIFANFSLQNAKHFCRSGTLKRLLIRNHHP